MICTVQALIEIPEAFVAENETLKQHNHDLCGLADKLLLLLGSNVSGGWVEAAALLRQAGLYDAITKYQVCATSAGGVHIRRGRACVMVGCACRRGCRPLQIYWTAVPQRHSLIHGCWGRSLQHRRYQLAGRLLTCRLHARSLSLVPQL